jgi:hypothetical protein
LSQDSKLLRKLIFGILGCVISGGGLLFISSIGTFGTLESVSSRFLKALLNFLPSFVLLGIAVGIASHIVKMSDVVTCLAGFFSWTVGLASLLAEPQNDGLAGFQISSTFRVTLLGVCAVAIICFIYWTIGRLIRLVASYTKNRRL